MLDGFSYFEFYILVLQVDTSLHAHKIECFVFCFFSDLCGSFVVLWANVVTGCNWWHKFITTRIGAWPLDRFNFLFIYSCYCGVRPIQYFGRRLIFSQQGLLTPTLGTSTGHQSWLGVATTRIADLRVRAPGFATTTTFPAHQIRCVGRHHRRHLLRPAGLLHRDSITAIARQGARRAVRALRSPVSTWRETPRTMWVVIFFHPPPYDWRYRYLFFSFHFFVFPFTFHKCCFFSFPVFPF